MTAPEVKAFHLGIVVRDLDAAVEGYRRLLNVQAWRFRTFGGVNRMAYGGGSGMTWELIEANGDGPGQYHEFRDRHGEGIQHVGFWTPDIRASVEAALADGARLVWTSTDEQGNRVVQLQPAAAVEQATLEKLGIGSLVEPGFGGWRIEYMDSGPAGEKFFQDWLQEAYDKIIVLPSQ